MNSKFDHIEVQCVLHTVCNLKCKFCFETMEKGIRDNSGINIDYILNLPDEIIKNITPIVKSNDIKLLEISTMGGEMFFDGISENIFNVYREFARDLRSKTKMLKKDMEIDFKVLSNGVYHDRERVGNFLKNENFSLVLSYDPINRFDNDEQKEIWYQSYKYFKSIGIYVWVATVLTKRSIYEYIKTDPIFERISNKEVFIESNIYVPRLDYKEDLPSDDDFYNFLKWCIDTNKFNITSIFKILQSLNFKDNDLFCTCPQTRADFMFSESFDKLYQCSFINKCTEESPIPKEIYYSENSDKIINVNNCKKYKKPLGLVKRGCLYCKYYKFCPKMCWTQILFSDYKITKCPMKRIYEDTEKDLSIMKRFNEWWKLYGSKIE